MANQGAGQSHGTGSQPTGPSAAQANVASIEEIMRKANTITKFPNLLPNQADAQADSPVRSYCISRLRSNWVSKISPFSSVLREYLRTLESTKRFSAEELLGPNINLVRNCMRLREQSENLYRTFLQEINDLDEQVYKAPTSSATTKTVAEKDAKRRADYWSDHSTRLSTHLDSLNDNMDQIATQYSQFLIKVNFYNPSQATTSTVPQPGSPTRSSYLWPRS